MVKPVLLADIGSTYTKVLVVDLEMRAVVCSSLGLTTADDDISIGLRTALQGVYEKTGLQLHDIKERMACSSAAGGLQMVAIGLVPELTAEAARLAALGAGARVIGTYSYQLNKRDILDIEKLNCDIILLAGGTDGGDQDTIVYNARKLAESVLDVPIIVAGNRSAADAVSEILQQANKEVHVTDNVLPSLKKLNIDSARRSIREIFMNKIVQGKGFEKAQGIIGTILMPTPAAVLDAARLLAEGWPGIEGLGDLIVVDVGGATTDVHSVADGKPTTPNAVQRGLPEPKVKRTVEGDLGLRVSACALLEAAGIDLLQETANGSAEKIQAQIIHMSKQVNYIPISEEDTLLELALAKAAVQIAVERHVGRLEKLTTPSGTMFIQTGKDLSHVQYLIGTGGIFAHTTEPDSILRMACMGQENTDLLKPISPQMMADRSYILWGMGLLSNVYPEIAFTIMLNELKQVR